MISLDEYREKFGDGTIAGEYRAVTRFIEACSLPQSQILEYTGAGAHKHAIRLAFVEARLPVIPLLVDTPLELCLIRVNAKEWTVPYPEWGRDVREVMPGIDHVTKEDFAQKFWEVGENSISIRWIPEYSIANFLENLAVGGWVR